MKPKAKRTSARASKSTMDLRETPDVDSVVAELKSLGTKATRDGMARFGLPSDKAFGVTVGQIQKEAKRVGRSHELALALWKSGWYEARMLAAFVDEPERVTPAQMDRWAKDFDSWGICDTVCSKLFDQTPHAFDKIAQWSKSEAEFEKRAAFALLACVALHDKECADAPFVRSLPLIERAASDERNFVKKGVSWALRSIGIRNSKLNAAAVKVATRLAASSDAAPRWVGKDALRYLTHPTTARRLAAKERAPR